jgi:hypothetical protein
MALVILQHENFPGLRFVAHLSETGHVVGWTVSDWRLLRHPGHREPPNDDPAWGPVTAVGSAVMGRIPFGELERVARNAASGLALFGDLEPSEPFSKADFDRVARLGNATRSHSRRKGQKAHDDLFYAGVAQAYVAALRDSRTPVTVLHRQYVVSRNTVANWLGEARDRELLTETTPGKAGGALTAKAKQLLKGTTGKAVKR